MESAATGSRHGDVGAILQHRRIEAHMGGLAHIIELLGQAGGDLLADLARIDGGVAAALQAAAPP